MPQEVILLQGIGNFLHFEAITLVDNPDRKFLIRSRPARTCDTDVDDLVPVIPIAVHNSIYHALPDRHPDSVLLVFVEAGVSGGLQNYGLGFIHTFEGGWIILVQQRL